MFNFNQLKDSPSHTKLILELDKLGARRNVNYKEIYNLENKGFILEDLVEDKIQKFVT